MATKLHGMLNLSKIDKNLITTSSKGDKVLWVDIVPNKGGADQYGNTHSIQVYNSATREVNYLGNLKPQEFGNGGGSSAAAAAQDDSEDLPF